MALWRLAIFERLCFPIVGSVFVMRYLEIGEDLVHGNTYALFWNVHFLVVRIMVSLIK